MKKLDVPIPGRGYQILIGGGLLSEGLPMFSGKRVAVVSDQNVWALYGREFTSALQKSGADPFPILLEPGERSKSLQTYEAILNALFEAGLKRTHPVIALGGGVVGDAAGFAAATYMRGVPFVQVPTTLLAQVDSSVGGKVAVNLSGGKNLVGSFYQPALVLIDTSVLSTLPDAEFAAGMAEVIKYGAISSPGLLCQLEKAGGRAGVMRHIDAIVHECCRIKSRFVLEDEFDHGNRRMLNFGHTFGHAVEKLHGFSGVTHGEAVSIGMVLACRTGARFGLRDFSERISSVLKLYSLPVSCDFALEELVAEMAGDKKSTAGELTLILLENLGKPVIRSFTPQLLLGEA